MLIGGVQDQNKANNVQLLMYRQEKKASDVSGYNISVAVKNQELTASDLENDINKA